MCCRLLGVEELNKQPGVWCQHCTVGKGCQIHEQANFPHDCREYVCLWRQMKDEGRPIADDLRPDRSKVVIDASKDGRAHHVRCDPGYPKAWQKQSVQRVLAGLAQAGSDVYLVTLSGTRRRLHTVSG